MFLRYRGLLAACALALVAACSSSGIPSNDGQLVDPTVKARAAPKPVAVAEPVKTGPVDVYVIALDDFPEGAAKVQGRRIAEDLGLNVRHAGPIDPGKLPVTPKGQYVVEDIIAAVLNKVQALPDRGDKTMYILYTKRDINDREAKGRYLFAQGHADLRISVISTHRMHWDYRWITPGATLGDRLWKMSKRAVGEIYYGLPRSTEATDLMYSPINGADDIDKLGTEFRGLPKAK